MRQHLPGRPQVIQAGSHRIAGAMVFSSKRQRLSSVGPKHWSQPILSQAGSHTVWSLGQEDVRRPISKMFSGWLGHFFQVGIHPNSKKEHRNFNYHAEEGALGCTLRFSSKEPNVTCLQNPRKLVSGYTFTYMYKCKHIWVYKDHRKAKPRVIQTQSMWKLFFLSKSEKKLNMVKMIVHMSIIPGETCV